MKEEMQIKKRCCRWQKGEKKEERGISPPLSHVWIHSLCYPPLFYFLISSLPFPPILSVLFCSSLPHLSSLIIFSVPFSLSYPSLYKAATSPSSFSLYTLPPLIPLSSPFVSFVPFPPPYSLFHLFAPSSFLIFLPHSLPLTNNPFIFPLSLLLPCFHDIFSLFSSFHHVLHLLHSPPSSFLLSSNHPLVLSLPW